MNLYDLEENKFATLKRTLSEVFATNFDFDMPLDKLSRVSQVTDNQIAEMKANGVDVSDKRFQKLVLVSEGLKLAINQRPVEEVVIQENDTLDQAEVLLAAKQMADDLQKMAENLASMQVEDLMSITNAMKEEVGTAEAEAFNASAEAAIGGALEAVKSANEQVGNAVLAAQGQPVATDIEMPMDDPMADPEAPAEEMPADDFEGADAADEMTDADGREMKEEINPKAQYLEALKMVKEAQSEGKVDKAVLKKAFESLKMLKPAMKKENTKGAFAGGGNSIDGKPKIKKANDPSTKMNQTGTPKSAGSMHAFK